MKHKNVCFEYERCLDSNPKVLKMCQAMLKLRFTVYIVTNLPESEFGYRLIDFALDNGIYHRNIIFNNRKEKDDAFFKRYDFHLYITNNEFEVEAININKPTPIACRIPDEKFA